MEKPRPLHKGLEHAMRCASEAVPLCIGGRAALEGKRIRRALDQARLTPADALTLDQQNLIDDGTGEYSFPFRLYSPSCFLGAFPAYSVPHVGKRARDDKGVMRVLDGGRTIPTRSIANAARDTNEQS